LPVLSRELLLRSAKGRLPERLSISCSDDDGVIVDFEDTALPADATE